MVGGGWGKGLIFGLALTGFAAAGTPARALDDGKSGGLSDVLDLVGLGDKKEQEVIQYRERAPLVLPPRTELRQPAPPAAQRAANWPQDQESVRAAKKAQENRFRAADAENQDAGFAGKLTRMGRINPADAHDRAGPNQACSMDPSAANKCDPTTLWNNLAVTNGPTADRQIRPGEEPDRQFLTQPPKGYMTPKKTMAATSEPVTQSDGNIFDYFRSKRDE